VSAWVSIPAMTSNSIIVMMESAFLLPNEGSPVRKGRQDVDGASTQAPDLFNGNQDNRDLQSRKVHGVGRRRLASSLPPQSGDWLTYSVPFRSTPAYGVVRQRRETINFKSGCPPQVHTETAPGQQEHPN